MDSNSLLISLKKHENYFHKKKKDIGSLGAISEILTKYSSEQFCGKDYKITTGNNVLYIVNSEGRSVICGNSAKTKLLCKINSNFTKQKKLKNPENLDFGSLCKLLFKGQEDDKMIFIKGDHTNFNYVMQIVEDNDPKIANQINEDTKNANDLYETVLKF